MFSIPTFVKSLRKWDFDVILTYENEPSKYREIKARLLFVFNCKF